MFISLILLSVVLLSSSVAFATDDGNTTLTEIDEVATIEETIDSVEVTDEIVATDEAPEEEIAVDDTAGEIIADNSSAVSNIVTVSTFHDFFDETGTLLENVTSDELIFEDDFTGIDVGYLIIDRPIKLTGEDAIFNGVSFVIMADDVTVDGFTLTQSDVSLFNIDGVTNVVLSNNKIDFTALEGVDSYAIYANCVSALSLINNTITYVGTTDGTVVNNAVRIEGDDDEEIPADTILVQGNTFDIQLPSVDVSYDPYTWAETVLSEGVVFYYCDGVEFIDNRMNLKYTTYSGYYDTIYGVSFRGDPYGDSIVCSDVVVANNTIIAHGHYYIYAVLVSSEGIDISGNYINSSSDANYANAININGPASYGDIYDNTILVAAPNAAYGIYSYQYMGAVEDMTYTNNTIHVNSYAACGMEIVECNPVISDNTISAAGNYTYGIVVSIRDDGTIDNNKIYSFSNNVGTAPTGDSLLTFPSMGISVKGEALIQENEIESTGIGVNIVKDSDITLSNNNITVDAVGNINSYAIYAINVNSLNVTDNNVSFTASSDGNHITDAVRVTGDEDREELASNIAFEGNTFDINIPSAAVYYDPDTWESTTMSEGIAFYYCENITFVDNRINLKYNDVIGAYDSIYALSFRGNPYNFDAEDPIICSDIVIKDNIINAEGHSYVYGIFLSGDRFEITNNNIDVQSDEYYANAIDIDGPASKGMVKDNLIAVNAPSVVYGIYSYQSNGAIEDITYNNNTIVGAAYAACGMEIVECNPIITENLVIVDGNYTYGIVASIRDNGTIALNNIFAKGSNVGNTSTGDALLPLSSMGLSVKGEALIENNAIESSAYGINLVEQGGMTLKNNNITVNTIGNVASYGIYAFDVSDLEILKNNIIFVGNTDGTVVNNAIRISGNENKERIASDIIVDGNTLDITLPSVPVYYDPDTWESTVMSEGVVFYYCEDVEFANNDVALNYSNASGMYDTIYVVSVRGNPYNFDAEDPIACANVALINNTINAKGHGYIYGIRAASANLEVSENTLSIVSDDYYACGIDVEGTSNGDVRDNDVFVISPGSAYGIYSANYDGAVQDMVYDNNTVSVDAYAACGMELLEANPIVANNVIIANGNYTYGVVASIVANGTIENNNITCTGSEIGNVSTGDSLLPLSSIGISVKGTALVYGNVVNSTDMGISTYKANLTVVKNTIKADGDYAIVLDDKSNATVIDNYASGKKGVGDRAITGGVVVDVSGNGPDLKVTLLGVDLIKTYDDGQQLTVILVDENGDALANKTIAISIGGVNMTNVTDAKGYAKFDIDLAGGNYTVISSYAGDEVYGPRTAESSIVVNTKATKIVSTKTVSVLLTAIKKGYYYKITLKDNDGKVLANKKVTIKFNGKTYTRTTDANGLIKFKLAATKIGNKKLTISFAGDENYTAVTKTATIKILKQATKIVVPATAFKVNVKTKVIKVTLKDSKNKGVGGVKVTLRVNGVNYVAKTVSSGVAAIKITKLNKVGSFSTIVKFAGNNYYKAASKATKIAVKK